jgi:hypothetical protein
MLSTPKKHLPIGYPLPSDEESRKFEPIFMLAFEIHKTAHDFKILSKLRPEVLSPVRGSTKLSKSHYCDCYERAYQELKSSHR